MGNPEDLIERERLEEESEGFTNKKYCYNFPYEVNGSLTEHLVHDLDLSHGSPFISLYSDTLLTKKQAYFKLSIAFGLYSLFEKEGFLPRPVGGIGGFNAGVEDSLYENITHSTLIKPYIDGFKRSTNSFQIQSRFTLSQAHAMMRNPEAAIIEFFKIVEIYIKNCAYTGVFTHATAARVLDPRSPSIFNNNVKRELVDSGQLNANTVDVIFKLKNVRNKFVGHGGIRPTVASIFGDPEDNRATVSYAEFQYDSSFNFGEPFYEKIMYDIEVVAVLLFCKLNDIPPIYLTIPGCWWQPNEVIETILIAEGVERISLGGSSPLEVTTSRTIDR